MTVTEMVFLQHTLASLALYVPVPVIGGYLAFMGIFCLFGGFALSTGLVINDFTSMLNALKDSHNAVLCLPGFIGGVMLLIVSKYVKSPFALATAIVIMPMLFFLVLIAGGISLDEARDSGWVNSAGTSISITEIVSLLDISLVHWGQIPRQFVTWLAMVFFVAFSSTLDAIAIETDLSKKLDIDHELKIVGWSNVVSGLFGGYTGSYNFKQTIFTCRSKTNSRLVGVCVALTELAIVAIPVSVTSHVPRFSVAATLIFVAVDLMFEWLVLAYRKMYLCECAVVWLTFIAMNYFSLELGILAGANVAVLNFILCYVRIPVTHSCLPSSAARPYFGESIGSLRPRFSAAVQNTGKSIVSFSFYESVGVRNVTQSTLLNSKHNVIAHFKFCGYLFFGSSVQVLDGVQKGVYVRKLKKVREESETKQRDSSFLPIHPSTWDAPVECLDGSPCPNENTPPTEFVIIDFTRVSGMDATAARNAFLVLHNYCKIRGIRVVFACVRPEIRRLLLKNKAANEDSFFVTAKSALEFCTKQLMPGVNNVVKTKRFGYSNEPIRLLLHRFLDEPDNSKLLQGIDDFFRKLEVPAGHEFYHIAESSDHFYFLAHGSVTLFVNEDGNTAFGQPLMKLQPVLAGSMFGEVSFFSQNPRQTAATAFESCIVFEMSRDQFNAMKVQAPTLSISFLDVIVQSILK
ncbi:unnamed protein product [Peronospora belbahrii]|uniref:STAS domain-containing protein n=1 Tax=Peronospora belbahrii TaxID=622444 RepID=A0ABN8D9D4_9STRA|nr:unnamed protein product [Peronospora belbahrii]